MTDSCIGSSLWRDFGASWQYRLSGTSNDAFTRAITAVRADGFAEQDTLIRPPSLCCRNDDCALTTTRPRRESTYILRIWQEPSEVSPPGEWRGLLRSLDGRQERLFQVGGGTVSERPRASAARRASASAAKARSSRPWGRYTAAARPCNVATWARSFPVSRAMSAASR